MPLEKTPWDGTERRQNDAGSTVISLKIATRAAEGNPLSAEQMFERAADDAQNHIRQGDFENQEIKARVAEILAVAEGGEVGEAVQLINYVEIEAISQDFIKTQYARPKSRECIAFILLKERLIESMAGNEVPNEVTSEEIQKECNLRQDQISRVLARIKAKLEDHNNNRYDDGLRLILVKTRSSEDHRKIIAKLAIFISVNKIL